MDFLDGVVNIETGEMVIPLEYDTIDVLADNKILLSKEIPGKEHCSNFYLSDGKRKYNADGSAGRRNLHERFR